MVAASWWGLGFLLRRLVQLPALLCCEAMAWAVGFLAFPLRLLAAVERERKMGGLVAEMQAQMDGLVWENGALEEKLRAAARERDALEAALDEVEEEHDAALAMIDALEGQLKALRQENMRLSEHKGKAMWDKTTPAAARGGGDGDGDGKSVWSESGKKKATSPRDVAALQEAADASYLLGAAPASCPEEEEAAVARQSKAVARRRSVFSVGMSLAVGAVAWSADAPCLPLLAGLFAVVGVSMRSVSRSCAALRRRSGPAAAAAAGDAVALLSLNWFLIGVLTAPMLPGVARAVVPRAGRVLGPAIAWLAAAAPL
ncbi:hypothetical protein ACP4OV_019969 [Aristida adscensionis]